jgi:NAD(P)-dependent dehydrogenase (short-subunit alcohol dehydrogenase family)
VSGRQRVAVVTGGGTGIGAAIAEDLGAKGWYVVTVDPLVTLTGSEQLAEPEETTAGRIVAAGGAARASGISVTDTEAVHGLFGELVAERGGLDAVINVAGITRQTGFAHGEEADWLAVLNVHLGGHLNVVGAALPLMAAAGHGRILGVTSGSGWRAADAGAYSCAKRAIAALTWQLGRQAPPGVAVNALSPMAATRMVAAALERARREHGTSTGGGGVSLASMAGPEYLGPLGAHLVGDDFGWCRGQVLFSAGTELAVVDEPRLLEVVRTDGATSLTNVIESTFPRALGRAEKAQLTSGGSNARFGAIFDEPAPELQLSEVRSCLIVSDRPDLTAALTAALQARSITCHRADPVHGFAATAGALASVGAPEPVDAVVVAPTAPSTTGSHTGGWQQTLAEHGALLEQLHADASWARAVADHAAATGRAVRLVTLTDATTSAGRSRGQAAAQLARVGGSTTEGRVTAYAASLEGSEQQTAPAAAELVAHLLSHPEAGVLAGAELVVGVGWLGLRSHPRAACSVTYGGPAVPSWLDTTLREVIGARDPDALAEGR